MRRQQFVNNKRMKSAQPKPRPMGRTENGDRAFSLENFLGTPEDALIAMNYKLVTKNDFSSIVPYFDRILNSENHEIKVMAFTLLLHFRDIEQGKGLRNPLIEGLMYIYIKFPEFVHQIIPHIP